MTKKQIIDKIIDDLPIQSIRGEMSSEEWYVLFEEAFDKGALSNQPVRIIPELTEQEERELIDRIKKQPLVFIEKTNQPLTAVAWPSVKDKIEDIASNNTPEDACELIVDFIKQSTKAIDLEKFLKWYQENHYSPSKTKSNVHHNINSVYALTFTELLDKYNEHLNKQG